MADREMCECGHDTSCHSGLNAACINCGWDGRRCRSFRVKVTSFNREASRVRRDELRRRFDSPYYSDMSASALLAEVAVLLAQADALESELVAADREVARLRGRVEEALFFIEKAAHRERTDEGTSAFRRAAGQVRAALTEMQPGECDGEIHMTTEIRPLTDDFYQDPNGAWVYRWSDRRRVLAAVVSVETPTGKETAK